MVLTNHMRVTLAAETEDELVSLKLQKMRRRFDGEEPKTKYQFEVIERRPVAADTDD